MQKKYIILYILSVLFFFSWTLGAKYLEWQKFLDTYKYPNSNKIQYAAGGTVPFCIADSKTILFETDDPPMQFKDNLMKYAPRNYVIKSSMDWRDVRISYTYTDLIIYFNDKNSEDWVHYGQQANGKTAVKIFRRD